MEDELTTKEKQIAEIIQEHKGRRQAITGEIISVCCETDYRQVRNLIKHLIEFHHLPIGATCKPPFGYFWCSSPQDFREAQAECITRAMSILRRAKAYRISPHLSKILGQLEIENIINRGEFKRDE